MSDKPIHSLYILFEEEPYITLLKKKISKFDTESVHSYLLKQINDSLEDTKEELKQILLEIYEIYREDIEKNPITDKEKARLMSLTFEELIEALKNVRISEEDKKKITLRNSEKLDALLLKFTELYKNYIELSEAKNYLETQVKNLHEYKETFEKLLDLLESYPKHLRFGFLDDQELKALRYITDTYFTFFTQGLILGDVDALKSANFTILPLIINIQETSLSKNAFFLSLLHHAPLVETIINKEVVDTKEETLKELYGIKLKNDKSNNEVNIR